MIYAGLNDYTAFQDGNGRPVTSGASSRSWSKLARL